MYRVGFMLVFLCLFFCLTAEYETLMLVEDFEENPSLGREISVIIIAKDFTQMNRRKHMLEKKKREDAGENTTAKIKPSRVMARTLERGVIMGFVLSDDELIFDDAKWKRFLVAPFDVSFHSGKVIISGGNSIQEIDLKSMKSRIIKNKYFRHLHTIEYSRDGTKCLVASTGLDLLIELDLESERIVWQYCPWEYGLNTSPHGHTVTRIPEMAKKLKEAGEQHIFVDDPDSSEFNLNGLATGHRPCHLNGGFYEDGEKVVGYTCGNHNLSVLVRKETKQKKLVTKDLHFPHSFQHQKSEIPCGTEDGYMICDSRNGSILFLYSNFTICTRLDVRNTRDLPDYKQKYGFEWIQFASVLEKNLYSVIDSRRKIVLLIDMAKKQYRVIPYPGDLSIQEVLPEPEEYHDLLLKYFTEKNEENQRCIKNIKSSSSNEKCEIRILRGNMRKMEIRRIKDFQRIILNDEELEDVINIVEGDYFPLSGFMNSTEFDCVLEKNSLCNGGRLRIWDKKTDNQIVRPIVLSTSNNPEIHKRIKVGEEIVLFHRKMIIGVLKVEEIYEHDPWRHSFMIFRKTLASHDEEQERKKGNETVTPPPKLMKRIFSMGKKLVSGKIVTFLMKNNK